jgi:hypothetical protein
MSHGQCCHTLSAAGCGGSQSAGVNEDEVREKAYLKWEAAGYPDGDGINFWLEAEAELQQATDQ